MECPKCINVMAPAAFGTDIKIMRCPGCGGLYCERETRQRMRDEWLVDTVLDTGSAVVGGKHNHIKDIACPGCGATMGRSRDREQAHIRLDICTACDGVFLDAGELTDMKTVTLMDQARRVLAIFDK